MSTVQYQLTTEEYLRILLKQRKYPAASLLSLGLIILGAAPMIASYHLPKTQADTVFWEGFVTAGVGIFFAAFPLIFRRSLYLKVLRKNPILTAPITAAFDDQNISFAVTGRKSEVAWTFYKSLTQDEQYFYLQAEKADQRLPLPKRAFDEASLAEFLRCSQSVPRA